MKERWTVLALPLVIQIETQIDTGAESPAQPRDYQSTAAINLDL